jgi:hypothetical protein
MTDLRSQDARLSALLDTEEIRALRVRYSHALDSGAFELFNDVFSADGVVEVTVGRMEGIEAIRAGLADAYAMFDYRKAKNYPFLHAIANHSITITGPDSAQGCCYLLDFVTGREDGHPILLLGLYFDTYKRIAGAWRIVHTRLDVVWPLEEK